MRNWNWILLLSKEWLHLDFILPMRNWNKSHRPNLDQIVMRFYLTYEELKPESASTEGSECTRFYLTYEELKLQLQHSVFMPVMGFYLTYEELKPRSQWPSTRSARRDFILPMRNWNSLYGRRTRTRPWDFILPMRNWNIDSAMYKLKRAGFYLTYEELKLSKIKIILILTCGFYLTYEELKRIKHFASFPNCLTILSYLWGIETQGQHTLMLCLSAILSYLWGIETAKGISRAIVEYFDFILPMRNWN